MIGFRDPAAFWLLLATLAIVGAWLVGRRRRGVALPSLQTLQGLPISWRVRARPVLLLLRILVVVFAIAALARPHVPTGLVRETAATIDVFLVLDVSSSMGSEDFQPDNRLEVAKRVIGDFVQRRPADRIGRAAARRSRESSRRCRMPGSRRRAADRRYGARLRSLGDAPHAIPRRS